MNIAQDEIAKQLPYFDTVNRDGICFDKRGRPLGLVSEVSDNKIVYAIGDEVKTIGLCNWPIDRCCE